MKFLTLIVGRDKLLCRTCTNIRRTHPAFVAVRCARILNCTEVFLFGYLDATFARIYIKLQRYTLRSLSLFELSKDCSLKAANRRLALPMPSFWFIKRGPRTERRVDAIEKSIEDVQLKGPTRQPGRMALRAAKCSTTVAIGVYAQARRPVYCQATKTTHENHSGPG